MAIIGLDIGGTKILGAYFNKEGQIIDKEKRPSKGEEGLIIFMKQVYKVLDALIKRNGIIEGIGVGVPGIVNPKGKVVFSPNLPLEDYPLKKVLEDKYNVPVVVGNDVNAGTFGEYSKLGLEHANVVGLFPGTGLGGGIIIDGNLYIGQGYAGELGHVIVQKDGVLCACGNKGCLESYASKKGIIAYLEKQIKKGKSTELKEDVLKGIIKSSKLKKAYDKKDKLVIKAMEQFFEYLGIGCGNIMNTFNPDVLLIGGGIVETFGEEMIERIKPFAKKTAMPGVYKKTKITQSQLGDDAVVYGGYYLVKQKFQ